MLRLKKHSISEQKEKEKYVFQGVLTQIGLLVISVSLFFRVSPFLTPRQIPKSLQCPLCCVNRVQNDTQKKIT